jgi:hypothetical protein
MTITVATLGDCVAHGYTIDAWCAGCETSRPVDVRRAAMKLGAGYELARGLKLRCETCKGRDVSISVSSPQGSY